MHNDDLVSPAGDDAVVLRVHVVPGAGRTAVVGRHGTALKVRVAAPPVGGRANQACVELLAATFGLKEAQVVLAGGETSRSKAFRLSPVDPAELAVLLDRVVEDARSGPGPEPGHDQRR